ncbi:MAG TPA: glycosyltransferase [Acidimicrobiia bacterium]|nr:glycosyltransferase [Acidimicrobiia bacterium]
MPRVVLVTSNGWGLGHLSRELAIALAIGDRADVTMFTFSRGFPLAASFGLRGEFCMDHTSSWIPAGRWDRYVERRFGIFLSEVDPDVVLFDGVAPYLGVINALRRHPSISAGWLRRGMWLNGPNDAQLAKAEAFDFVVEPGDIAAEADEGPTAALDSIRVPPVSLLEVVPTLGRDEAAAALGLDPEKPALLFALGSGQPGDAVAAREAALRRALRHVHWQVGVVTSPLTGVRNDEVSETAGIQVEGIYPLMRYLSAFDAAVSAAGYNSVHELIPARVPTLFVPKTASRTDNQVARASFLADHGLALMARDDQVEEVETQVESLLGHANVELTANLEEIREDGLMGGAVEVARIVTSSPPTGVRETGVDDWRQPGIKGFLKRVIPPTGVEYLQQVLRKSPPRHPGNTVTLHSMDGLTHLLVSEDPADVVRSQCQPVEHMLAEASPSYHQARRNLINEFYDLVG